MHFIGMLFTTRLLLSAVKFIAEVSKRKCCRTNGCVVLG